MKIDEVPAVIDVHPPNEPIHGLRDFALHLFTITVGLLIALSLEGCVEWQHHRHLVRDAEASMHGEIASNAQGMAKSIDSLHQQQKELTQDIVVLDYLLKNHKMPAKAGMSVNYEIETFDNVGWKTAQATGALAYMPYARAQEYAEIYTAQDLLTATEQQSARDAALSIAPFLDSSGDHDLTSAQAENEKQKIEVLGAQLMLVDAALKGLNGEYKKFLAAHPN